MNVKTTFLTLSILLISIALKGQQDSLYSTRFILSSIDTSIYEACYDLQIRNTGDSSWTLNSFLFNIYFDPSVARIKSDSGLVRIRTYSSTFRFLGNTGPGDIQNSGLPFEQDSIALFRIGLSAQEAGLGDTLLGQSDWYPTHRICFDILAEDMTAPSSCLQISFHNEQIEEAFVNSGGGRLGDDFIAWFDDALSLPIERDENVDILPMTNRTSCFIINEAEHGLCADGQDNDEDGLADCDDCDCSPGDNIMFTSIDPTCANRVGSINFTGAKSGVMYSIDGGVTYQADSAFVGLDSGRYELIVRMNNIADCQYSSTVTLRLPDCREADAMTCADGMDNDLDGLIDDEDDGCCPMIIAVMTSEPANCPQLNDGEVDIMVSSDQVAYSIDSGATYSSMGVFSNLTADTLYVLIRDTVTGCLLTYDQNPVILNNALVCPEDCSDGIDNDLDGLVDCEDDDCASEISCLRAPIVEISNIMDRNSTMNNFLRITSDQTLDISLNVYDRWGNKIYANPQLPTDNNSGWQGLDKNGDPVSTGVYIYHINYVVNDIIYDKWGDVTVLN